MAEHTKFKSSGRFHHTDGSPCKVAAPYDGHQPLPYFGLFKTLHRTVIKPDLDGDEDGECEEADERGEDLEGGEAQPPQQLVQLQGRGAIQ